MAKSKYLLTVEVTHYWQYEGDFECVDDAHKYAEKIHELEDPETADGWWLEDATFEVTGIEVKPAATCTCQCTCGANQ